MALTKIQAAGLTADLIDETKLADNSIDSEHYNDGSIDNAHLADDAVGIAELSATGTAGNTTYLRGDNTWTVPPDTNTNVLAGGTITGDVIFDNATNAGKDLTWDMSDDSLEFADNTKAVFGDGGDLKIYHNGTDNYIMPSNGKLIINNGSETLAQFISDGAVELYHNGVKKLNTDSGGIEIVGAVMPSGNISMVDNAYLKIGTDDDLKVHFNGTSTYFNNDTGDLYLKCNSNDIYLQSVNDIFIRPEAGENGIKVIGNAAVELYHDNTKKLETASYGVLSAGQVRVSASNATTTAFSCGDAGTGFYNSGSNAIGYSANGTQKININSSGNFRFLDSVQAEFGSDNDLHIYHSSNENWIKADNGVLNFLCDNWVQFKNKADTETLFRAEPNGGFEAYYDGTKKIETTNAGGTLSGTWSGGGLDNAPAFSAYTSTQFDLASDTWVKQLFQTEEFDSDSAYDASTSTFTVPSGKGGKYMLNTQVSVDDINQGAYLTIGLYINGSLQANRSRSYDWSPDSDKIITAEMNNVISLSAGDTVNIYALHSGTGTQSSENHANWFSMFRLSGV